jgi:glycosyltransferase involved in cell wall biosynthesis
MRILLATYWGLPFVGGVEQYVFQLKRGLEQQGHTVDIFCKMPDNSAYYLLGTNHVIPKDKLLPMLSAKVDTCFASRLPGLDPWIQYLEVEKYCYEAAAATIRPSTYDIIHSQDIISTRAFRRVAKAHVPIVATIHGCLTTEIYNRSKLITSERMFGDDVWPYLGLAEGLGVSSSHRSIIPTQWLKNILVQYGAPEPKMSVVPYGMDHLDFIARMGESPQLPVPDSLGRTVFICPARFDSVKGHTYLIQALSQLKQTRQDWVCWLVGMGELEPTLRQMTADMGLTEHVLFLGSRPDVPALLRMADIFVLPSVQDNHPFAVMEAQLAGKPCVVSNAGGIPEMVEHLSTGYIAQAGDAADLGYKLGMTLDNKELNQQMSYRCVEFGLRQWSLDAMVQRTTAMYEETRQICHAEVMARG